MTNRVNLMSPEVRANPFPTYARMRRESPVCEIEPGGIWAVSRHADVFNCLRRPDVFSSEGFRALFQPPWLGRNPLADSIVVTDPPRHAKLRRLVSQAFAPRVLSSLAPRIRAITDELADGLKTRGEADFVEHFCIPMPARVIGEMLGVDAALHPRFRRWGDAIAGITPMPPSPERAVEIRAALDEMEVHMRAVIAAKRRSLGPDITSELLRAEVDGERLTDDEVLSFLFFLLPAGFETTGNLLAHSARLLIQHPDVLAQLRAEPALIPDFIEEALRIEPPAHAVMRVTIADTEVAGTPIARGSMVLLLLGSANHDEAQFPEPERFILGRNAQATAAFSHGIHFCVGAALARLEGQIAIESLLARFRGFEAIPSDVAWSASLLVRGPTTLPLRFLSA